MKRVIWVEKQFCILFKSQPSDVSRNLTPSFCFSFGCDMRGHKVCHSEAGTGFCGPPLRHACLCLLKNKGLIHSEENLTFCPLFYFHYFCLPFPTFSISYIFILLSNCLLLCYTSPSTIFPFCSSCIFFSSQIYSFPPLFFPFPFLHFPSVLSFSLSFIFPIFVT